MKQKRNIRKLDLNKETIVNLEAAELNGVNGGRVDTVDTAEDLCPATLPLCASNDNYPCDKTKYPECNTLQFTCARTCTSLYC